MIMIPYKPKLQTGLYILLLCYAAPIFAQGPQAEFLEAKRLFKEKKFRDAKAAFLSLKNDVDFSRLSLFLGGISAYRENKLKEAESIFKQLLVDHMDWHQIPEVYFWLMTINFETADYEEALMYKEELASIVNPLNTHKILEYFLPGISDEILMHLLNKYPKKQIAVELAKRFNADRREEEKLRELILKYDISPFEYGEVSKKKDTYRIAVFLPFVYESSANMNQVLANDIILDLYLGMKLAKDKLESEGIVIELYPFDTKKDEGKTARIITENDLKDIDAILGPLIQGPIDVVSGFSQEHKIPMFNMISINPAIFAGNEYGYLLKPNYQVLAKSLATYAMDSFPNGDALVYYTDTKVDSTIAWTYKNQIEKGGLTVGAFSIVDNAKSRSIAKKLAEINLRLITTVEERDSLMALGKNIEYEKPSSRESWKEEYALPVEIDGTVEYLVHYEKGFAVSPDTFSHIFISSRDNGVINNFIGAIEARSLSGGLLGYGSWWDEFQAINYEQLERLEILVASPGYFDKNTSIYKKFDAEVREKCACPTTRFHTSGYESTMLLGRMLGKYGTNLKHSLLKEGYIKGVFSAGFKFDSNNNQVVPLISIIDNQLVPVRIIYDE